MRSASRLLAFLTLALVILVACGPLEPATPAPPATPPAEVPAELRETEMAITEGVNDQRREQGLNPLEHRDDLAAVARSYSERMLEEGFFGHVDPEGEDVSDRVLDAGISFLAVGENLYLGEGPIDHVEASVSGWMQSPGHRQNILREQFSQTGVGMAREGNQVRVTQVFLGP
jgi:uncharacterized protein YkwD